MTIDTIDRDGLVLSSDFLATHTDVRHLSRAVARGELVKIRRGAYVRSEVWGRADPAEQHLIRARAVAADSRFPIVLAGFSAAAVHGMPVFAFPDQVQLLEPWKGGGRSVAGVRRIAAAHPTARVHTVDGFSVTDIARTALELTRQQPFARAIGSMDWALWKRNPDRISLETLQAELAKMTDQGGHRRAAQVVAFATELSDSFGESMCRALMWECGFEVPRLQREIYDAKGLMVPDYSWDYISVLGEFDGRGKYHRALKPGEDVGDAVWKEKVREDRLRALGFLVIRIIWADLIEPERLIRKLLDAGVPRRR